MEVKVTDESWSSRDVVSFMIATFIIIIATLTISPNTVVFDDWGARIVSVIINAINNIYCYAILCNDIIGDGWGGGEGTVDTIPVIS